MAEVKKIKARLEPCPCCKSDAVLKRNCTDVGETFFYSGYKHYIECKQCGLRTKEGDVQEVIANWNRRDQ